MQDDLSTGAPTPSVLGSATQTYYMNTLSAYMDGHSTQQPGFSEGASAMTQSPRAAMQRWELEVGTAVPRFPDSLRKEALES